ncbi:MAG: NAD(P)/FAD-dependent oxidoreductase [Leptolyngbya sp. SIO1E4]|nr:NAD(P)/FAD-dependent oxidoreductase [Leptolyngbya sp. SIO1E4]
MLILGGGFAGLFTALYLSDLECPLPVTLIDRNPRFIFKPLLYELLSHEVDVDVAWPHYEELLSDRDVTYVKGSIGSIDLQAQQVELESGLSYGYRYLVIALGDIAAYFNVPGAEDHAFTFRTAEDALNLGKHLRQTLQQAVQTEVAEQRQALLTTAIVGAGPSGVELAATLADLLPAWYETLGGNPQEIRVVLLQRSSDILQGVVGVGLQETAEKALNKRRIPVELRLNSTVQVVEPDSLTYCQADTETSLAASTIVWTAGSATHPLIEALPIPEMHCDPRGRPYLTSALQLIGLPNVFAGGDCAVNVHAPQPATAQVAYQQGRAIAQNIMALIENRSPEPADVKLRGNLIKLGMEESTVEILKKVKISGHIGHLIRQAAYLNLLPTPARNLKLSSEWITDELFEQFLGV